MPTTRKQRSTGRGAGAKQPSGTYRKRKDPEKAGPGLREAEELIGRQRAKGEHRTTVERLAIVERLAQAQEVADKALRNPRPLPKRKAGAYAPAFVLRVVRRYEGKNVWLELTEVHMHKGKPFALARPGTAALNVRSVLESCIEQRSEAEAIQAMRDRIHDMLTAFSQPILDERTDFGRVSDSAT